MIYIDLKIVDLNKVYDLKLDEMILVQELITEINNVVIKNTKTKIVASVREKKFLKNNLTLAKQGIRGGDTLVLIEVE